MDVDETASVDEGRWMIIPADSQKKIRRRSLIEAADKDTNNKDVKSKADLVEKIEGIKLTGRRTAQA